MSFLRAEKIKNIGFKRIGNNVLISEKASFHNPGSIRIGDNTRIDDFVVLSAGEGGIHIGRNVHIGVHSSIIGRGKIIVKDFSGISSKVSIYSSTEDFSGNWMTNPTISSHYRKEIYAAVRIGRHVIIGSGSVILPNVLLEDGVAIGALSLVREGTYESCGIYIGVPARIAGKRSKKMFALAKKLKIRSG